VSEPSVDVVVCTYTLARIDLLLRCVGSVAAQLGAHDRLWVVIDAEDAVAARCREQLVADRGELPAMTVLTNRAGRGLSGARNTGLSAGSAEVVAFIDDDAEPRVGWLDALRRRFSDPAVEVVGGAVVPRWSGGAAPAWFPEEFGWVVGCDYAGMPGDGAPIRNPIGANMAIRRSVFARVGGFDEQFGRVGAGYSGCEETELSLRAGDGRPPGAIVRDTSAVVDHLVSAERQRFAHLVRRCYDEGRSKALLSRRAGPSGALSSELRHVRSTLPRSWARTLRRAEPTPLDATRRVGVSVTGLLATAAGFATASIALRRGRR
jgi:GT2 family glycosyltransferase